MRLGPFRLAARLSAALLAAPAVAQPRLPVPLPWDTAPTISWRAGVGIHADAEAPVAAKTPASANPITVTLSADGTLHLVGAKGVRRLRMGLPGRPLRVWRDAGIPLPLTGLEAANGRGGRALPGHRVGEYEGIARMRAIRGSEANGRSPLVHVGSWRFPKDTPLAKGIQALPWGGDDFRIALAGLLWIIDDGEHFLTVVHPATARVVYLPLPPGQDFTVRMTPGYLELLENPREASTSAPRRWSLPWLALLPHFAKLARPDDIAVPGTALIPFPNH
ncbi:MAG: hypothetical protein KGN80_10610 [Acidobacteriota bacterium]|nr:hypothetical protein [Acidobacteriota bacterium]